MRVQKPTTTLFLRDICSNRPHIYATHAMLPKKRIGSNDKYVRLRRRSYIHTCRSHAWPARWTNRPAHGPRPHGPQASAGEHADQRACPARLPIRFDSIRFGASGETKFSKVWDSLPRTPMNHRANLTPLALSSAEKSFNRTNTHTITKTNKQTNKQ